ncbi:MAG: hypothetical protein JWQ27_3179 [Ferruginibacter sp.]|nr:hypothetical protein [Ferruginibacter sp.]
MGTYLFSKDINAKVDKRIMPSAFEDLTIALRKYVDINGRTIDEVIQRLEEVSEDWQDREGAVMRHIKYTRGTVKLTEESEEVIAEARFISFLLYQAKELKAWAEEKPES